MYTFQSPFLKTLSERGFIQQTTNDEALDNVFKSEKPVATYIGFDCTAASLHVGSLIQLMMLRWLQKHGHKPIILLGGGTSKVGDPSGKEQTRRILEPSSIEQNASALEELISKFVSVGEKETDAVIVNNADWLSNLNYIDFLRDVGKHFSVNRMLTQESVKNRLEREQNLSFLEFNYMILQAYDFVELQKRYGCKVQIGGSDQWGNIIMGIDLARRLVASPTFKPSTALPEKFNAKTKILEVQPMIRSEGHELSEYTSEHFAKKLEQKSEDTLFGLTSPLLTTASGQKMGKTENGAIWLDKDMLPPYEYWQYWRNIDDKDVSRFLRLFTELPIKEIEKLEQLKGKELNDAKKVLASQATSICHGSRAAKKAEETAKQVFEQGILGTNLTEYEIQTHEMGKGIPAYEIFRLAGLCKSGGEAKRLIRGGGGKINDRKIIDENQLITKKDFLENQAKLTAGKKRHMLLILKD